MTQAILNFGCKAEVSLGWVQRMEEDKLERQAVVSLWSWERV